MAVGTGGTLSDAQLTEAASRGGFTGSEIPIAVAIAKAESSGNPRAHNNNASTGDNSYGLWQINMIGSMGPARQKLFGITSNDALFDPTMNAKAAYQIYKSQGWNAWSVYKSGSYKKYLGAASESSGDAVGSIGGVDPRWFAGPLAGLAGGLSNKTFDQLTEKFRLASITYLVFLVALVLLILGVVLINRERVGKVAGALPAGKVSKLAKGMT